MPRKRNLVASPLAWSAAWIKPARVPPPPLPVVPERGGTQLRTPLPIAIIDTREQNPLSFRRFKGWFAKIEHRALRLGDYSVAGMEDTCVRRAQRSRRPDLLFHDESQVFVNRLRRMSRTSSQPAWWSHLR